MGCDTAKSVRDYVLLVEDDADIIEALDLFFTSEGIAWRSSVGEIDRSAPPTVALLDLSAGVAPDAVAARLRELKVPIVVASAAVDARKMAERIGAVACLEKPYELPKLLDVLKRIAPGLGRHKR